MKPRVILKKTSYLKRLERGNAKRVSKYLEKYVDEVGKALSKRGEAPWVESKILNQKGLKDLEPKWLLPKERTGIFYTGGFLGNQESPGNSEPNKQKGWIRTFTANWIKALEKHSNRRNDGFRFILGLSPECVKELTACNISCDQAMREIWSTTIELYRERHGWASHKDELAWLAGAHHDTDNAHMHIMLFPTTKSGKLLRTNNRRGKEKINDLNDLIAMVNISAEMYYRDIMPFDFQSNDFKVQLLDSPEEEPPIPSIDDFTIPSGLAGDRRRKKTQETQKEAKKVQWDDIRPLDPSHKIEMDLEYEGTPFLDRIKKRLKNFKGKVILAAMSTIAKVWGNKKIKFFPTVKNLSQPTEQSKTLEQLESSFPDEVLAIKTFEALEKLNILGQKRTSQRLHSIIHETQERGHAIVNMAIGLRETVTSDEMEKFSKTLLNSYNSRITGKEDTKKLELLFNEGIGCLKEKQQEDIRRLKYQTVRRGLSVAKAKNDKKTSIIMEQCISLLDQMIEGSRKVSLALEARHLESEYSIGKDEDGNYRQRVEDREWDLIKDKNTYKLILNPNKGKPWPPHLDPDLVIEPLKLPPQEGVKVQETTISRTNLKKTKELISGSTQPKNIIDSSTNPLEIIIAARGRKRRQRRSEARQMMRQIRRDTRPNEEDTQPEKEIL